MTTFLPDLPTDSVLAATSLPDLCRALNELDPRDRPAATLVMPLLPTFGGEAPVDTRGVWSWDETSVLVGEAWRFEVRARAAS